MRSACYVTITADFQRFQSFNFETSFCQKQKAFLEKLGHCFTVVLSTKKQCPSFCQKQKAFLEKLGHCFLVESTTVESAKFPQKKVIVKTNRMGSTKWTYHKERRCATNYIIFLKI